MVSKKMNVEVLVMEALELPETGSPSYRSPRARIGCPGYGDPKDVSEGPR